MRRRSRAGRKSPTAQASKAAARKGRIAGKAVHPRGSSAREETKIARLTRERDETLQRQTATADENARLLNELRESLEQQTATAAVLGVISSSQGELAPVFQSALENATRICEAKFGLLWLREGDAFRSVALHGVPAAYAQALNDAPLIHFGPETGVGRVARTKQVLHIEDIRAEPAYVNRNPQRL